MLLPPSFLVREWNRGVLAVLKKGAKGRFLPSLSPPVLGILLNGPPFGDSGGWLGGVLLVGFLVNLRKVFLVVGGSDYGSPPSPFLSLRAAGRSLRPGSEDFFGGI